MKQNCTIPNPLVRDGTSQQQRLLRALRPEYARVDERSLAELILFARRYAGEIQYYDNRNQRAGDWRAFIENDISTTIATIAGKDRKPFRNFFNEIEIILESDIASTSHLRGMLQRLFDLLFTLAHEINEWFVKSVSGMALYTEIERIISSELKNVLRDILQYYKCAEAEGYLAEPTDLLSADTEELLRDSQQILQEGFDVIWIPNGASWHDYFNDLSGDCSVYGEPAEPLHLRLKEGLRQIGDLFEIIYGAQSQLIHQAPDLLQETIEKWPAHEPHMALFLTFLQLFGYAQEHLNTITRRHLEFFYQEVLQFKPREEMPDTVHVIFELAKQTDSHLLEAGTRLKAGKDSTGKDIIYKLANDVVLNKAQVADSKSVYLDRDENSDDPNQRVYKAPVANSPDGVGGEFETEEPSWKPFGETQWNPVKEQYQTVENRTMQFVEIGFAITSPILRLAEGNRTITLTLDLNNNGFSENVSLDSEMFVVAYTGDEEWVEISNEDLTIDPPEGITAPSQSIDMIITIHSDDPPVTDYNSELHESGYDAEFPILKIALRNEPSSGAEYIYQDLHKFEITGFTINVDVDGITGVILQNDAGILDPGKPVQPFGAIPKPGSSFYIGSNEIFRKKVDSLSLHIDWLDAPIDFADYYEEYNGNLGDTSELDVPFNDDAFGASLQLLEDKQWKTVETEVSLFTSGATGSRDITSTGVATQRQPFADTVTEYNTEVQDCFLKMELTKPSVYAFGQSVFSRVYAKQVIALTNYDSTTGDPEPQLPNEPYVPTIKSLKLDYESEIMVDLEAAPNSSYEALYHVYPFGTKKVYPGGETTVYLLPQFRFTDEESTKESTGEFYLGISNLKPPQNLSLLFQIAEGSADPTLEQEPINWSYLSENKWVPFQEDEIVADSTNELLQSGIIQFAVPNEATADNMLLSGGFHWIRGAVAKNANAVCEIIDIQAQAASASFVNEGNAPDFLSKSLPAESVTKLEFKDAAIKGISQPYASFGGRVKEQEEAYYTRTSERLRHKSRGIAIWDYERLVLENFPEIHKVKCINHSTYDFTGADVTINQSEFAPGYVSVIVIPDLRNKNAVDPLKPRVSLNTLDEIKEILSKRISPFAAKNLRVINPLYERIKVDFNVEFRTGYDRGYYLKQLKSDIKQYLSPWAYDEGTEITFGGRIHKSMILNFVEERRYVDYVTDFKMNQYITDNPSKLDINEAVPTTARSILVSDETHGIGKPVDCS